LTRPRLLAVCQGGDPSGYRRVMGSILAEPAIAAAFEPVLFAPRDGPVRVDPLGQRRLPGVLGAVDPSVVLVLGDATYYAALSDAVDQHRRDRPGMRVVVYCPVDWTALVPAVTTSLALADQVVAYTEFGRRTLTRAFRAAGLRPPPLAVIPHGVDTGTFRPLADRRRDDEFVVLNANRNLHRKRVDLTLQGFALFARGRPRARLYLHMGMRDHGCDVRALAAELGIGDRLLTTTDGDRHPAVSDERLNEIYNACDVGLNTCEAEGWGLVSFEHAATGAPQVVPDGSACAELWRDAGTLVPTTRSERGGHVASVEGVAAALGRLHDDPALAAEMGARARAHATAPRFSWSAIAERWLEVLTLPPLRAGRWSCAHARSSLVFWRPSSASPTLPPPRSRWPSQARNPWRQVG
jgi:D-inositol-3-phosphate glycosyltransferase